MFGNWNWWPNTFRAHQWIQYGVEKHGLSTDALNHCLFDALYEKGMNLSLVDSLVELGKVEFPSCNEGELRLYLQANQGLEQVHREINEGKRRFRIRGVPYFVFGDDQGNDHVAFSGAQSATTILEAIHEVESSK